MQGFFVLLLFALLKSVESTCQCSNYTLCKPISNKNNQEVFVFSLHKEDWVRYDWSKITTIVEVGYHSPELVCHAHKHNARVVAIANFQPAANLTNKEARTKWIQQTVTTIKENYLDGVNVDFESPIYENQTDIKEGLTTLMEELHSAVKSISPVLQVSIDYAWAPNCIDGRCFDYKDIANFVDLAFVMAYDERSQIFYECMAWANSPYNQTIAGVDGFLNMGIPANKLVLGLPWYGYDYPCQSYDKGTNKCYIKSVPFRGVPCSDAAGSQVNYKDIQESLLPASSGLMWNDTAKSPYFTYMDPTSKTVHQVWFDNPQSLSYKYNYAKSRGLRGVGMWQADAIDYSGTAEGIKQWKEMWGALPSTKN